MSGRLPIVMVTAIVSPSARPSARIVAPKMPARAAGSTTFHIVSHQVAPRATLASRMPTGTARITSRAIELSVGSTITDSTSEATSRLVCRAGAARSGMPPSRSDSGRDTWSSSQGART